MTKTPQTWAERFALSTLEKGMGARSDRAGKCTRFAIVVSIAAALIFVSSDFSNSKSQPVDEEVALAAVTASETTTTSTSTSTSTAAPKKKVIGAVATPKPVAKPKPPVSGGEAQSQLAREIFDMANQERAKRGIAPLIWSNDLVGPAEQWSAAMASKNVLGHRDLSALSAALPSFERLGENIMVGPGTYSASQIHASWMNSAGHRANILEPRFNRIGIGVYSYNGQIWATQEFGKASGSASVTRSFVIEQ